MISRRSLLQGMSILGLSQLLNGCGASLAERSLNYKKEEALNNQDIFNKLPYDKISEHLGLNKILRILYPGAGVHFPPLTVAAELQKRNTQVDVSEFMSTEIGENVPQDFLNQLNFFKKARVVGKLTIKKLEVGYEVTIPLKVSGEKVNFTYAISTTNQIKGDHAYFRKDQANANVVVLHDSFGYHPDIIGGLNYLLENGGEEKQVIIMPDIARVLQGRMPIQAYDALPGKKTLVKGHFGCEVGYEGAVVYFPDKEKLKVVSNLEEGIKNLWQPFTKL